MECSSGKQSYTKTHIQEVRKSIYKTRAKKLRIYECDECHQWHLTSTADKSYKGIGSRPWSFGKGNKFPL